MTRIICYATLLATLLSLQACGNEDNENDGTVQGYECVDLGLSVKWAVCNIGATAPEDYGDYFAWGELSPKETYTMENAVTYGDATLGNIAGHAQYDAAQALWGDGWRLPTKAELHELLTLCTYEWTAQNGVFGARFTSTKNGNSIFLPAAGCRDGSALSYDGSDGYYWSATPYEYNSCYAYTLNVTATDTVVDGWFRDVGRTIRPVAAP